MAKFSKRHYEAVATALQEAMLVAELSSDKNDLENLTANGVRLARDELAAMFARDNYQFNTSRFKAACEVGANVKARTRYQLVEEGGQDRDSYSDTQDRESYSTEEEA